MQKMFLHHIIFFSSIFLFSLLSCDDNGNETDLPVINSFAASSQTVEEGESITLTWDISGADRVFIDNGIGSVQSSGSIVVTLNTGGTYIFVITAVNSAGSVTATISVTCTPKDTKLLPSSAGIYHSAFVLQNCGWEDEVTAAEITGFENLVGKKLVWVYFSNNWFTGISFPSDNVNIINSLGQVPFVRLMPRHEDQWNNPGGEKIYTMQNFIDGMFDTDLRAWARVARDCGINLLIEFGTEVNGEWFPWNGKYNGSGTTDGYGDLSYPDGPERFRDAYRHIINLFREEGVRNVTWFFHANCSSYPAVSWNEMAYYYPGDEYIDWIGVSVYGPQDNNSDYESFTSMMDEAYPKLTALSATKPIALLEFSIHESGSWSKAAWIADAFNSLIINRYPRVKAVSWWNEKWKNEDGSWSNLTVNSSPRSLDAYRQGIANSIFITSPVFTGDAIFKKNK